MHEVRDKPEVKAKQEHGIQNMRCKTKSGYKPEVKAGRGTRCQRRKARGGAQRSGRVIHCKENLQTNTKSGTGNGSRTNTGSQRQKDHKGIRMSFNTEEFVRELIEMYRSLPCLWQIKSADYSNRNKKREAFAKLVALFKQHNPSEKVDESVVRKKIQGLRTVYKKELNKVVKSKKSGAATDEVYVPSLWYFDLLGFTRDQELLRTMASSMRQTLDEDPVIPTDTPVGDQDRHDDLSTPTSEDLLGDEPSRAEATEGSSEDPAPSTPNTAYVPRRINNGRRRKDTVCRHQQSWSLWQSKC
ncbi:unnamed protein product [Ranitomeya imitator]|uniref:MADF domain-containing protein n=1 Tax=Ranitomeya imitator TaxID=111125 RepID=A0ABN9MLH6_9NEOB|nr:unnamed protein product [Ranitomeya imitator]